MLKREERVIKLRKVRNEKRWIDKANHIEITYNPFFDSYDAYSTTRGYFAFGETLEEVIENVKNDYRFW